MLLPLYGEIKIFNN